ncbi:MAG: transporter substrate-binding domain-containing protein [Bariatricus sp.]
MSGKRRLFVCLTLVICLLAGCSGNTKDSTIQDVHHLDGQNVGVVLAWGPDYLLTGRDDLNLVRYNTVASMVTALCYGRVDAVAVEGVLAPEILRSVEGVRRLEEPIAVTGVTAIMATDQEELLEEFNAFIKEFQDTDEYKELVERSRDEDGYQYKEVAYIGGGKPLKVGLSDDNYPFTYINFETGEYEGIDIEVLRYFANAYGYDVEFSGGTWEAMSMGVTYGKIDMGLSGISDLYRDDYLLSNAALVSDVYMPADIVFLEVEDRDKLRIKAAIDY